MSNDSTKRTGTTISINGIWEKNQYLNYQLRIVNSEKQAYTFRISVIDDAKVTIGVVFGRRYNYIGGVTQDLTVEPGRKSGYEDGHAVYRMAERVLELVTTRKAKEIAELGRKIKRVLSLEVVNEEGISNEENAQF